MTSVTPPIVFRIVAIVSRFQHCAYPKQSFFTPRRLLSYVVIVRALRHVAVGRR